MATNAEKPIAKNPPVEENPKETLGLPVPYISKSGPDPSQDPTNASSAQLEPASNDTSATVASRKEVEESKATVAAVASVPGSDAPLSDIQKKMRRAERFGISVQLSEEEKRNSRAERFGNSSTIQASEASKSEELKRKARAERFGIPSPSSAADEEAKKKARLARFAAPVSKTDSLEEDKRKARAIRFSNQPSSSLSEVNGKGNLEPKAAIAGKAGGEA